MFRHLLIPLDGSQLAESVLPAGIHLARALGATITLLHIVEARLPHEIHGEHHLSTVDEARSYLKNVSSQLIPADIPVHIHVHREGEKNVARSIVEHEGEFFHDLIVMCTHGKGGATRFLFGSIAQQVVGSGTKPVLVIRTREISIPETFRFSSILLPLDGLTDHEQGIEPACAIAQASQADVHLLTVVRTTKTLTGTWAATGKILPVTMKRLLNLSIDIKLEYLRKIEKKISSRGFEVHTRVLRGDPSSRIVGYALKQNIDLIVLGTHGRHGFDAFFSASVMARVCGGCKIPLLLVP